MKEKAARKLLLAIIFFSFISLDASAITIKRTSAASAVLPDGNFLICGGVNATNTALNSCEIYDVTKAADLPLAATMNVARSSHTMTVLSDGRILIVGGFLSGSPLGSSEILSPGASGTYVDGAFAATPPAVGSNRGGHTATLISRGANAGNVLICGGQTGAAFPANITDTCIIFNTANTAFGAGPTMTSSRFGHTASLLPNGKILISGGINNLGTYLSTQEMYDNVDGNFTGASPMLEARAYHTAVTLNNGSTLIIGGYNPTNQRDQFSQDPRGPIYGEGDDDVQTRQNQGTQGFIEAAELFDNKGSRVPISGSDYSVLPYRISKTPAVLRPDGIVDIIGGYGNIPVSYFDNSPTLQSGSTLTLTTIGLTTAAITGGNVSFQLDFDTSRHVHSRIVNGDIFISAPPEPATPNVTIENAQVHIGYSTATVDGKWIGGIDGGRFTNYVTLENIQGIQPAPYVTFEPYSSKTLFTSFVWFSSFTFFPSSLGSGSAADLYSPTTLLTLWSLYFTVPQIYIGSNVTGTVTIKSAELFAPPLYTVTLTNAEADVINAPVSETYVEGVKYGRVNAFYWGGSLSVLRNIQGLFTNTTDHALHSGVDAYGKVFSEGMEVVFSFTPTGMALTEPNTQTSYTMDRSTLVVREAIMADEVQFNPKAAAWSFAQVYAPIFDNNTILTPASDILTCGGRNCELDDGTNDCIRTNPPFKAQDYSGVLVYENSTKWTSGQKLNNKRAYHTSTLLPDDSILTCGGTDGKTTLSSCELYDPVKDKWVFVSSMTSARAYHTSTLLPNGNVLIAGGTDGSSTASPALKSAEIYYPDTKRTVPVSDMNTARMWHTATLLADGNVLVAGGATNGSYSNSAEVFITTANIWQPAGDMGTPRMAHTATFLKNNTVLMAGGINGSGALKTTDIFNPGTRTFSPGVTPMTTSRYYHTANLLKDGRVLVVGGTDGYQTLETAEIFAGGIWTLVENMGGNRLLTRRANHTSTLLPNGKVIITGGEKPSMPRGFAEGYDVDFSTFQYQGAIDKRTAHTTVLNSDGYLVSIGGFDGTQYLDTTEKLYFGYTPDSAGLETEIRRQPTLSSATPYFDRGERITLLSGATNFHGISEASGGGAGAINSSYSNPRFYLNAVDNPSSFLVDITTRVYSVFGGPNIDDWETTLSSVSLNMPIKPGEMPYGWYNLHACANGQFSEGFLVQVTSPRPTGLVSNLAGTVLSSSSVRWNWDGGPLFTEARSDGYAIFSSSNNVFISTAAMVDPAVFYQRGLPANTQDSIKITGYNMGGYGKDFTQSATYYTFANPPTKLTIDGASFETITISWDPNGNSDITPYEMSMSRLSDFSAYVSTPIPFSNNFTSTSTTLSTLLPNQNYYFRVRAKNGDGIYTVFDSSFQAGTPVSTVTVGDIGNLQGTALTVDSLQWSWDPATGADGYWMNDVTAGTTAPVFVSSQITNNYATQPNLSTNTAHIVGVRAYKDTLYGPVYGPFSYSTYVYTLASDPLPGNPEVYTNVTTGSVRINWIPNGNPPETTYLIYFSTHSDFVEYSSYTALGSSYTVSGLKPNYNYYSSIYALNGNRLYSANVNLGSKYTRARPPYNVKPTNISMSGVNVQWDPQDNSPSTVYELRGSTDGFINSVSTYIPFYYGFMGNSQQISGLWTNTTYYFDVAAMNAENYITARTQCVPSVVTVSGPQQAPPGAIGGTSDPSQETTISGTLPNGRKVAMTIPQDSFASVNPIAVAVSTQNVCGWTVGGTTIAFTVYSDAQPQTPVTFDFYYTAYEQNNGIDANRAKVVLARYNPLNGQCLPLETSVEPGLRKISAKMNHFSIFQLTVLNPKANFNDAKIYPNPFYINQGQGFVTITGMPAAANITIYTLSGDKVITLTSNGTGTAYWDGKNKKGHYVGSAVYLVVIKSGSGKKIMKLVVEK